MLERIPAGSREDGAEADAARRHAGIKRRECNHLLSDWLNVYIRDAAKLKTFEPDPAALSYLLGGIAPLTHMQRSLRFLLREGFLRRTLTGQVVQDEPLVTSTDDLPSAKIRAFHKKALALAARAIAALPADQRRQSAMIMHLNGDSVNELKEILKGFHERLMQFAEDRPDENETLYQVIINLTPISLPMPPARDLPSP